MRARADGTGANNAVGRTSGRGRWGGKAADGRADEGGKGADSGEEGRTGPTRRGQGPARADGRTGGQAVGWTGGLGGQGLHCANGGSGRRADERVGLGLKGHIPQGPLHSWAPSPLASSERERAGCLGVQWGPPLFHVKHPYLAPGLTCLV